MPRISDQAYREILQAEQGYRRTCEERLGTPTSWESYIRYAGFFVRWLNYEFEPGFRLRH